MWFLYGMTGALNLVLFRIVKYRKDVVIKNLNNSFPDKSEEEKQAIAKKFFKHLSDLIAESIKVFSISSKSAKERMILTNPEIFNQFYDQGRSVLMVGGHYGNWEMFAVAIDDQIKHRTHAVYTPIKNKFLDEKMRTSRGKFGLKMVSKKEAKPLFESLDTLEEPIAMILATDQSPGDPKKAYWMEFLNQDTGVIFGTEKYSKAHNMPVLYGEMTKVKRGHYTLTFEVLFDNPSAEEYGKITEKHTKRLEQTIHKCPELWLWSHKRWKKTRPADANVPR